MLAIPTAQRWQIKYFRRWMKSEKQPLIAIESHFLDDEDDVIALRKVPEDAVEVAEWLSDILHSAGKIFSDVRAIQTPEAEMIT